MNAVQKSAAQQLFALTYLIVCIVGCGLQAKWGLIMAVAVAAFIGLCIAGFIIWAMVELVLTLIDGRER